MSDISKPVEFTEQFAMLVQSKVQAPAFSHKSWGDEDLMELRSYVRKHYRQVQKGRCAYCRQTVSLQSAANCHVEHIAPKSK